MLLWLQLLDYAKSQGRPLVFVTGDVKKDWWVREEKPRPELVQEMLIEAGVAFWMHPTDQFMDRAKRVFDIQVRTEAVEEAREIREEDEEAEERLARFATAYPLGNALPSRINSVQEALAAFSAVARPDIAKLIGGAYAPDSALWGGAFRTTDVRRLLGLEFDPASLGYVRSTASTKSSPSLLADAEPEDESQVVPDHEEHDSNTDS